MALTKTTPSDQTGSSLAGSTAFTGSGIQAYYGVSGVVKLTNAGSGMSGAPSVYMDFSHDNSTWNLGSAIAVGDSVNNSITYIPFSAGIGSLADFAYVRIRVTDNTGGDVGVVVSYAVTTGL